MSKIETVLSLSEQKSRAISERIEELRTLQAETSERIEDLKRIGDKAIDSLAGKIEPLAQSLSKLSDEGREATADLLSMQEQMKDFMVVFQSGATKALKASEEKLEKAEKDIRLSASKMQLKTLALSIMIAVISTVVTMIGYAILLKKNMVSEVVYKEKTVEVKTKLTAQERSNARAWKIYMDKVLDTQDKRDWVIQQVTKHWNSTD